MDAERLQNVSLTRKEKRRIVLPVLIAWLILSVMYNSLLFIEGYFIHGETRVGLITFAAGTGLILSGLIMFFAFPNKYFLPLFLCLITQLVFLIAGTFRQELEIYYFGMFLVVGVCSMMKNFRLLVICVSCMAVIDIYYLIFQMPGYEWLDHYRFFMKFSMFLFGAILLLKQTYNVSQKEDNSERALAAFTSLLRSTPNMMVITGTDNRVLYLSDQMAKFIQYPDKDFAIGQPLIDLIADKGLKIMFADMLDADGFYETITEIHVEGETRFFKIICDKLVGEAKGMFIDISDITPTVQSNIAMKEAQAAAIEANSAKTKFLANMSHEIRTPMNAIIGISEIELEREGTSTVTIDSLKRIYNSGHTLLGIINDILDLSKIETGKFDLTPVEYETASLINDTVRLNIMRIGTKPVEFMLKVAEDLPRKMYGDELRIKQILNNILSNAIKYTDEGRIVFEIGSITDNDVFRIIFSISDTGQGMTDEQLKSLYDEYSTFNREANRATEGTGLGMSITKSLIEMMNGEISAKSEVGKGSAFVVNLVQQPVGDELLGKELTESLQDFKLSSKTQRAKLEREYMPYGKVLIVDDVDANLFVAKGLMKPYGLNIETVLSGYDALERIFAGSKYDVIFMDHMMHGMDGIETTRLLREKGYTEPIIALTANAVIGQEDLFLKNGFDAFLSKPIDIRQLDMVLNEWIRDKAPSEEVEKARQKKSTVSGVPEEHGVLDKPVNTTKSVDPIDLLRNIESLDVDPAIEAMSGLSDMYLDTVKLTLRLLPDRLDKMDKFINENDLASFTVEAHGLKSVLKNIGASSLGSDAAILEREATEGNRINCLEIYPDFKCELFTLVNHLTIALQSINKKEKSSADISLLIQDVAEIRAAVESFDSDLALELISPYTEFIYGGEYDNLLTSFINALEEFDCEGALEIIMSLEDIINGTNE